MATYRIENNKILIAFEGIPSNETRQMMKEDKRFHWNPESKVWIGANTLENKALAQKLTGTTTSAPISLELEERLQMCIESSDSDAMEQVTESLMDSVEEHLDEYLELIHRMNGEERVIKQRIAEINSKVKEEKEGYEIQRKNCESKRDIVEKVIATYLNSVGEDRIEGNLYNVSIKESYIYKLSEEYENELKAKVSQLLPPWIDVEFKISREVKKMDPKPDGIVVGESKRSITVWSVDEMEPGLRKKEQDLLSFKQGKDIKTIARERGVQFITVCQNLKRCINEGLLIIQDYISQDDLDQIVALYQQNNEMTPYDYVHALGNKVSYDVVLLSLYYLGLSQQ